MPLIVDKDECQYGNVCPFNSVCENTVGSYRCACNPGLEKRGRECVGEWIKYTLNQS